MFLSASGVKFLSSHLPIYSAAKTKPMHVHRLTLIPSDIDWFMPTTYLVRIYKCEKKFSRRFGVQWNRICTSVSRCVPSRGAVKTNTNQQNKKMEMTIGGKSPLVLSSTVIWQDTRKVGQRAHIYTKDCAEDQYGQGHPVVKRRPTAQGFWEGGLFNFYWA